MLRGPEPLVKSQSREYQPFSSFRAYLSGLRNQETRNPPSPNNFIAKIALDLRRKRPAHARRRSPRSAIVAEAETNAGPFYTLIVEKLRGRGGGVGAQAE